MLGKGAPRSFGARFVSSGVFWNREFLSSATGKKIPIVMPHTGWILEEEIEKNKILHTYSIINLLFARFVLFVYFELPRSVKVRPLNS
jgi:hypothetical protein